MYPNEARMRNLSYSSHIFCDIVIDYFINSAEGKKKITKTFEKVNIEKFRLCCNQNYVF